MHPALAALLLIPAVLAPVGGCTLVDQRTFQAEAPAPGAEELARAQAAARPLVSVRLDQETPWRPALAEAVQAAQQRRPGAAFDVMALVPTQAAPAEQDRRVAQAAGDARTVAEAMGAAGVPAEQVRLGLRGDPGTPAREVRVFQR
jgi:hypothetical protein